MEFGFNIPGARRVLLMGKESHDPSLGGSEIHCLQSGSHGLVGTPVENSDEVAIFIVQNDHLPKRSLLQIYSNTTRIRMQ